MKFTRRLRRSTKQYITVALICIFVIGSAAVISSYIMIRQIKEEYSQLLNEARQTMDNNRKSVFIALSDIAAGEILSQDLVEEKIAYTSQPSNSYITEDDLGRAALIDIAEDTHILKSMLAEHNVSSVIREVEYDVIHISSNIDVNDYVDIRIQYPNGESYVVLTKKPLKGFNLENPICYLWVDEEEMLRMSAAIVNASLYHGSKLYMTKYIEPNIQEASIITYTPSVSILSLIENDPNIVNRCSQVLNKEVRKALENRLAASMDLDIKEINWKLEGPVKYMPEIVSDQTLDTFDKASIDEEKKQESSDYKEIQENTQLPLDIDKAVDLGRNQKTSQEYEEFEAGNDFYIPADYFSATEG